MSEPQNPPPGGYPPAGGNPPPNQPTPYQPASDQPPPNQPPPQSAGATPYQQAPNQPPPYQQAPNQPPYGAQPTPYAVQPQAHDPGKTLGIIGLVLSFFTALIGMIISIIAFRSSKKAGFKNAPALAGIIIGAVFTVGAIIGIIALVAVVGKVASDCSQLGPGVHVVNGVTYRCG